MITGINNLPVDTEVVPGTEYILVVVVHLILLLLIVLIESPIVGECTVNYIMQEHITWF